MLGEGLHCSRCDDSQTRSSLSQIPLKKEKEKKIISGREQQTLREKKNACEHLQYILCTR